MIDVSKLPGKTIALRTSVNFYILDETTGRDEIIPICEREVTLTLPPKVAFENSRLNLFEEYIAAMNLSISEETIRCLNASLGTNLKGKRGDT